jgi:hypothetical protein
MPLWAEGGIMTAEYRISTIKDFLAVPPESIDACLADFKVWLNIARQPNEFCNDMNELIGVPDAMGFSHDSFTWIADGIIGIAHVDIVDASDDSPIARISFGEESC